MARNKHPEETVNRILDAALALFLEKGFDHTSIQDIIDNLGGLTKGAVYHHFKSKEDILSAALDRENASVYEDMRAIRDDPHLNGAQKLQALFGASVAGSQIEMWAHMAPAADPVKNARLLGLEYRDIFSASVPYFVEPIIRQGVADGSIQTEYPRELAEVLVLLGNLWAGPMFRDPDPESMQRRMHYFIRIAEALGAPIADEGYAETLDARLRSFMEHSRSFGGHKEVPPGARPEGGAGEGI